MIRAMTLNAITSVIIIASLSSLLVTELEIKSVVLNFFNNSFFGFGDRDMDGFRLNEIIPDVVSTLPQKALEVNYVQPGKQVALGNEIPPKYVIEPPEVKYEADPDSFYTLIFTDPDAPSRQNPIRREWHHWLVVNIPGSNVSEGEVLSEYVGSAPPQGSGLHRYVFLLYKQPQKLTFDEPRHSDTDGKRGNFSAEKFANKYNLGKPLAGNFFVAEYDDSCPASRRKLGFE